jgi:alpha-tubulin suppressor-like RCC1 family protein
MKHLRFRSPAPEFPFHLHGLAAKLLLAIKMLMAIVAVTACDNAGLQVNTDQNSDLSGNSKLPSVTKGGIKSVTSAVVSARSSHEMSQISTLEPDPIALTDVQEGTEKIIPLTRAQSGRLVADACAIHLPTNVTVTTACTCDALGECTVGITGAAGYSGPASFSYTLSVNGIESTPATATMTITAVDDAPVASDITPAEFNEDSAVTITLSYTDAEGDKGTACTISELSHVTVSTPCSCDDAGVCTVGITGTSDYFGSASFAYTVTANGADSNAATATLTISAVNDAPTDITLSSSSISEHLAANTVVGTFAATDVDSSSFTYSLVSGIGSTDNAFFNFSGNSLRATNTLDYETKSTYAIRVQVSDGSLTFEKLFNVTVLDIVDPATGIVCGPTYCAEIRSDRSLWMWGSGAGGQLGDGNFARSSTPVRVAAESFWVRVAIGGGHTLAIRSDGTLWAWGANGNSQLGLGDTAIRGAPVQVGSANTWKSVGAYVTSSFGIQFDGSLWAWGGNGSSQLGLGDTTTRTTPTRVGTDSDWSFLAPSVTANCTLVLKTNNTLWAWGWNNKGECGTGNAGTQISVPTQVGTATWRTVAAGNVFSVGIQSDGTLWTWGNQANGRLGNGTTSGNVGSPTKIGTETDWISVVTGISHVVALKGSAGSRALYAWGSNLYGQIGNNTQTDVTTPLQIGSDVTWQKLAAGTQISVGQKADGSIWAWGTSSTGEFGDGATLFLAPTQMGTDTNWANVCTYSTYYYRPIAGGVAIKSNGTLWAWGGNSSGILGQGDTVDRTSPTQVGTSTSWSKIACGGWGFVLATRSDGTLWGWGNNGYAHLGLGDTTRRDSPVQIGTATYSQFAPGMYHSHAIKSDGTLWAWGYNAWGQLGLGDTTQRNSPVQIGTALWTQVSTSAHTLAIRSDGTLWAWGNNSYGQVGDGTTTQQNSPVQIGSDTNWISVKVVGSSSFARKSDGTLWAWGYNEGVLGLGDRTSHSMPTQVGTDSNWTSVMGKMFATKSNGTMWAWGSNDGGVLGLTNSATLLSPTQITESYIDISSQGGTTMAIKANGTLWGWGESTLGQLGNPATAPALVPTQVRAP